MVNIYKFKNWEVFLVLFLIPFFIQLNLFFIAKTLVPSTIFNLIWVFILSIWIFKLADYFETEYIKKSETILFNVNIVIMNLMYVASATILLLAFKEIPVIESALYYLPKINDYLSLYIYFAIISISFTAARIITTKKLQRKPSLKDYYQRVISFIFLPIGIFWIQKDIIKILEIDNYRSKNRGYVLIGLSVLLALPIPSNFKNGEFKFVYGAQNREEFTIDSILIEKYRQQDDSLFNIMDDSAKANYIYKNALILHQNNKHREALNNLNLSIKYDSLNSEFYYSRGVILYQQFNQLDSAILNMTKTINLNPSDWRAYQNRGYYYFLLENYEESLPDINKVIYLNPDLPIAYLLRGMLKEILDDIEGACIDFKKADNLGNEDAAIKLMQKCN